MGTLIIFIMGAIGTFGVIKLRERNLIVVAVIGALLLYGYLLFSNVPGDWRVFIANSVSLAVLCFIPVVAVFSITKLSESQLIIKPEILVVVIGGLSTAFFQYVGFSIAYVLGVSINA